VRRGLRVKPFGGWDLFREGRSIFNSHLVGRLGIVGGLFKGGGEINFYIGKGGEV